MAKRQRRYDAACCFLPLRSLDFLYNVFIEKMGVSLYNNYNKKNLPEGGVIIGLDPIIYTKQRNKKNE